MKYRKLWMGKEESEETTNVIYKRWTVTIYITSAFEWQDKKLEKLDYKENFISNASFNARKRFLTIKRKKRIFPVKVIRSPTTLKYNIKKKSLQIVTIKKNKFFLPWGSSWKRKWHYLCYPVKRLLKMLRGRTIDLDRRRSHHGY